MGYLFPSGGGGNPGPPSPDNTSSGVFGHGSSDDTVSYSNTRATGPSAPDTTPMQISFGSGSVLVTLVASVTAEYSRRRADSITESHGTTINHNDINGIKTAIEATPYNLGVSGFYDRYGYQTYTYYTYDNGTGTGNPGPAGGPAGVANFPQATAQPSGISTKNTGDRIYASDVNALVDAVIAAGQVCVCNCNYCTCNCNYCTCNCNYACTCNCNY